MSPIMEYKFQNNEEKNIILIVEPWAEEFTVNPGSAVVLKIFNELPGSIDTEINKNYFVIWLWKGCRAEVFLDGKDLTPRSLAIPAFG